jgi:hypothetical protein
MRGESSTAKHQPMEVRHGDVLADPAQDRFNLEERREVAAERTDL